MRKEKIKVNTTMDKEMLTELKILAIRDGKKLTDILEEAGALYLKSREETTKKS
jgi:hypothetical protein